MKVLIIDDKNNPPLTIGEFHLSGEISDHLNNEGTINIKTGGLYKGMDPHLNICVITKEE
jgi:hypothetical protein